ncbi:uncharacterized protein TM35_000331740 [Trypanosoma theileri]|uniref:Uncharacterized protein n=1 Tax=Trypanosoma theileri TaxID=67003 RepID=A0A1X0NM01_9TRYP|nr:uncharacterized protein TM35_000331740 [Trypanosoma theileri]ORC85717.1 hypothetical protein TM35_000331740 [Trypanosoma theileri]
MCEAWLAFPWGMEVRKLCAAIRQAPLPKASRGSLQRSKAPTPRCWQKKKLRRVRHHGFQRSITDRRANEACGRLTSQIGRDMVHSAKYGRTRNTRKRTYHAPGVSFPAPPPRGEFSVLRVPCVSSLRALLGLVTVVLGHIFAHKLTLVGVGLFRCFGFCRPGGVAAAVCHNLGRLVAPGWGGSFLVEAGGLYNSCASAILAFYWLLFSFWSFVASVCRCAAPPWWS